MRHCFSPLSMPISQSFSRTKQSPSLPQFAKSITYYYAIGTSTWHFAKLSYRFVAHSLLSISLFFFLLLYLCRSLSLSLSLTPMYWAQLWAAFNHINVPTARHFSPNFRRSTSGPSALLLSPSPRYLIRLTTCLAKRLRFPILYAIFLPASFLRFACFSFLFFVFKWFSLATLDLQLPNHSQPAWAGLGDLFEWLSQELKQEQKRLSLFYYKTQPRPLNTPLPIDSQAHLKVLLPSSFSAWQVPPSAAYLCHCFNCSVGNLCNFQLWPQTIPTLWILFLMLLRFVSFLSIPFLRTWTWTWT